MIRRPCPESVCNAFLIVTLFPTGRQLRPVLCNSMRWCLPHYWTAIGFIAAGSVVNLATAQPMPHGVLEQFPEPRIVELVPAAHHQHPPPAIMAGFDFEGFELSEELQSDEEESDSSSSSAEESDSALDDSPSLSDSDSDSDSVSSRW
ncbi:Nucleolar GTP-binding protein 2 [Frankliniella fusca]|uniref:Nucleolar GTP-binding protein 2 n=1 Tax=Frankliniella fusca TaxID=407009 RepID=A0AAE1H912_9NEOP|nr:Nucleolar GTP-binding protein 2 [Frankliniella fusca]